MSERDAKHAAKAPSGKQPAGDAQGMRQEQVLGKAYDVKLMARLWTFVAPHWRLLGISLLLVLITPAFELAQPYLLGVAVDEFIKVDRQDGIGYLVLGYLGLVLLQATASFAQLYVLQLLGQRSMHDLRVAIYRHVLSLRTAFFDRMPVGRLLTRMTNDVENINEMFANGVVTLLADFIKLIAIVVVMLSINVKLTLMTFLTVPLLVLVVNYARILMRNSFREIRVKLAALNAFAQEHLSGIKVVQLFAREQQATDDYGEINAAHRDAYLDAIRADAVMYAFVEAIGVVSIALITWYASGAEDPPTIGVVVAFIEYVRKFFIPIRDFSAKYTVMQSAMAASERIMALLDTDEPDAPERAEYRAAADSQKPAETEPASGDGRPPALAIADLSFAYRPGEEVLRDIDFAIPRGAHIAVVGASGSGKSTIIKLLARLYEIERGRIELDGRDIRALSSSELRRRVTVVSQDVFLFAGTVGENIRLGRADATDDELRAALERVGADRVLLRRVRADAGDSATRGRASADEADAMLALEVAERGGNFSAGERQLIAFARALVRDPDVLVLDEATAHVDPEAEALIENGVAELMRDRTTLVIAHRLSTIRHADQILVMSRGSIVERGSHDELIARGGVYAKLERTFSRKD